MRDPRELIWTDRIRCDQRTDGAWCLGGVAGSDAAWATWPEVVAFAEAILAADRAWKNRAPCGCDSRSLTYKTCRHYDNLRGSLGDRCVVCGHGEKCHEVKLAEMEGNR